jgi:arsenate reductase
VLVSQGVVAVNLKSMKNYSDLDETISNLDFESIPLQRKLLLREFSSHIKTKWEKKERIRLNFICTHNSRRSQLSQVWAKVAAFYNHLDIDCFSGGTEVTAIHSNAINVLRQQGFQLKIVEKGAENQKYQLSFAEGADELTLFSKFYDDAINPSTAFTAVMNCSDADLNCPTVLGADCRFSIPYDDPKQFDHSAVEKEGYEKIALQIASEMFYIFNLVAKK